MSENNERVTDEELARLIVTYTAFDTDKKNLEIYKELLARRKADDAHSSHAILMDDLTRVEAELVLMKAHADRLADALAGLLMDTQHAEHQCTDTCCPVATAQETLALYRKEIGE